MKRVLFARVVPLISVFAAFSFVVMMFNLPLPGGTTGHAVGVTIAAIVLGPSGAILALSIAIAIQALFFGDGGISTLGANCFNMAIVGSLVAYGSLPAHCARAAITSKRRVIAAAAAGYVAVNASALLAAIEFGIQPMLFHDASGTPLYAPYPAECRDSGDDDRTPHLCRPRRSGDLRRTGRVPASCRSESVLRGTSESAQVSITRTAGRR